MSNDIGELRFAAHHRTISAHHRTISAHHRTIGAHHRLVCPQQQKLLLPFADKYENMSLHLGQLYQPGFATDTVLLRNLENGAPSETGRQLNGKIVIEF